MPPVALLLVKDALNLLLELYPDNPSLQTKFWLSMQGFLCFGMSSQLPVDDKMVGVESCGIAVIMAARDFIQDGPKTVNNIREISRGFEDLWNLPHCVGAIDGKHVNMKCPNNSGSLYYNYKGFFSLVLMAICDSHYNFTLVDIGDYGGNNDGGVLSHSDIGKAI